MKMCCAVLLGGLIAAGSAAADPFTTGLYTVIGYSGAFPNYHDTGTIPLPTMLDGVEADVGWRFNRFYSIEGSYSYFTGQKTVPGLSLTETIQNGAIDALGYLPLGYSSPWAIYSDVGAAYYFANSHTGTFVLSGNSSKFGWRAGGGLQFMIDEDLGIRLGGRYERMGFTPVPSAEVFTIGLVWQR